MALTVKGFGSFLLQDPVNNEVYALRPNAFTITEEIETEEILAYPNSGVGTLTPITTITTSTTYTLNIESGWFSDQTYSLLFNQRESTETNVPVLRQTVELIPAAPGPYTVTITGLTLDQTTVRATLIDNTLGDTYMTRVADTPGPAATGEFSVAVDTVEFNSADAGKTVMITYEETEASIPIIGGPATIAPIGTIQFFGKAQTSSSTVIKNIWCKEIIKTEGFEFGTDVDNLTFSFGLNTPSDWNLPFMLY